eukprot:GEMP01149782.1.p1 GENE.GEMP01149782.1~~GEMP01149782.1.p1  ORF type:complete len:129 (-),score=4.17 GEMP01149782.1:25-411(-)
MFFLFHCVPLKLQVLQLRHHIRHVRACRIDNHTFGHLCWIEVLWIFGFDADAPFVIWVQFDGRSIVHLRGLLHRWHVSQVFLVLSLSCPAPIIVALFNFLSSSFLFELRKAFLLNGIWGVFLFYITKY